MENCNPNLPEMQQNGTENKQAKLEDPNLPKMLDDPRLLHPEDKGKA